MSSRNNTFGTTPLDNDPSPSLGGAGNVTISPGASVPNQHPSYLDAAMGHLARANQARATQMHPTPPATAAALDQLDGFPPLGAPPRAQPHEQLVKDVQLYGGHRPVHATQLARQ